MEIRKNVIVHLGYGKYARSDKIIALEPIAENRGPGRRTLVYVEQMPGPVVASRTEHAIVTNIVQASGEELKATAALELLRDLLDDIDQIGPMLRISIHQEASLNLDQLEQKIKEVLGDRLE